MDRAELLAALLRERFGPDADYRREASVDYPTEQCRTCQASIIWTTTDRLRDMPVDAEPDPKGNLALTVDGKGAVRSRVVAAHLAFGRKDLRLSHFVKCPQADKWRRR